jgi:hypothetical protein
MADYTVPSTPVSAEPATTYDLPNFVGELFTLIPAQVPFLSMSGGLTGGESVMAKEFTWQVTDNVAATAGNVAAEGADPSATAIIRQEVKNVVEIHQEAVDISYTKQAATAQLGAGGDAVRDNTGYSIGAAQILGGQPVQGEIPHQLSLKINQIARDVEMSFLSGTYAFPDTLTTGRETQGILGAIDTHDTTFAVSIKESLDTMLIGMYSDETTVAPLINPVIFVNGLTKVTLSTEYTNNLGLADRSRTVGGVNVETLITDFGTFGIVLDRYMPTDELLLADMSVVAPCFLPIPGKGHFFTEPLAKTGSFDRVQIYGEIGLKYGPEQFHGRINTIT